MRLFSFTKALGLGVLGIALAASSASAQCPSFDGYEPNNDCIAAPVLTNGTYNDLTVHSFGGIVNEDFFTVTVPVGEVLSVDCLFTHAVGDLDLYLYDPATSSNCGGDAPGEFLVRGFTLTDNEQVHYANPYPTPRNLIVRVDMTFLGSVCSDYDLIIDTSPNPCILSIDDGLEDNDTCGSAIPLTTGLHTGLFTSQSDLDYYRITVPAQDTLTVETTYSAIADVDLILYSDLTCTTLVGSSFSHSGSGQVSWANASNAPVTVTLLVAPDAGSGDCNDYDLNIFTVPDPCANLDDAFEDNDNCASSSPVFNGVYPGLFTRHGDDDYYEFTVDHLDTVTVDILFTHANGDIDIELYQSHAACTLDFSIAVGASVNDNEVVSYTNTTGGTLTMVLHVYHFTALGCNNYEMVISGSGDSFATPMCFGDGTDGPCPCSNESALGAGEGCSSSVGIGAILTASGSASVAADDIVFTVTQARANQSGLLLQGATPISTSFKDGILCMGIPTERIEFAATNGNGTAFSSSSIVSAGNVVAGNTRYYQWWFRDPGGISPCGTGSNFSNGLTVVYAP